MDAIDTIDEDCIVPTEIHNTDGASIHPALARILVRNNRIKQRTGLWYTTRRRMITCSDMAAVAGINPYSTRNQVFKKKTGQSRPFKGNAATARGTRMEPEGIAAYERVSGKTMWPEDIGLLQHPEYKCIGGSADGVTMDGILFELKCPLTRRIIPGHIPEYYMPQVQVLMEICDLEVAHFVQYRPGNVYSDEIVDITVIPRDRMYFARILPMLLDFMADVTAFYERVDLPIGTPMVDWSTEDPRQQAQNETQRQMGVGRVCTIVDGLFITEDYGGVGVPVIRKEHKIVEAETDGVLGLLKDEPEWLRKAVQRHIQPNTTEVAGDEKSPTSLFQPDVPRLPSVPAADDAQVVSVMTTSPPRPRKLRRTSDQATTADVHPQLLSVPQTTQRLSPRAQ